ncbi:nitrate/nitrite two-component system sensor histidine kinase NarQ [Photobacterium aphoticum]|nr:nitrate/nitrite two-component system sensor histidine kinase NarQ [Photobacterium aphoticum]PSU55052.1 nitrate/nitrite two-component system sensor histidine kinase NarQ [Photobacterium aphoticum]GHA47061.1 histidine kinase [Photobacterium aphoticum]
MHTQPLKPVTTTIARAMLAIVLLSVVTTSFALLTLASSLNDAEAINVSGSLRMQSYRLAYDIQTQSPQLNEHLEHFEQSLFSPSMAALEHWTVPRSIQQHYDHLIVRWHDLYPLLQNGHEAQFLTDVARFVDRIDQFVYALQEFSIVKLQLLAIVGGVGLSLILLITLFIIHFTQRKIVNPLNQLVHASEQVQNGQFDLVLPVKSDNELGILTGAFSTMASELGKLYRNLEKQVDVKTRRLRQANDSLQVLYDCSQELKASRLSAQNFHAMLNTMNTIEGITATQLIIEEPSGANTELMAGEPTEAIWHYQDLEIDGKIQGRLGWQYTLPCPDHSLIENISRTLARGIYYNRAQKQAEQLLLMEERATIARELHDSLAQSLSYLKIQVTLLKRQVDDTAPATSIIRDIDEGLSGAYTQLRELLSTFRLTIKETHFGEALRAMLSPLEAQSSALITIDNQLSSLHLEAHHQVHLLQLIREAVLNAIKHASATAITVRCQQHDETVTISIQDDGLGFDPNDDKLNHYGLAIMTERASRLHGTLTINTAKGEGCTVTLHFTPQPQGYR